MKFEADHEVIADRQAGDGGLSRAECLVLLRTGGTGRVALSIGALPVVLPVDFVLLDEDVVFRPFFDTKLSAPGAAVVLAFQVDHFDGPTESSWSVLVQGLASEVVEPEEIELSRQRMPRSRGAAPGDPRFARIATTILTGRTFVAA